MSTPTHYHVTAWGWFWLIWLGAGIGVETYWAIVKSVNTLSYQWWGVEMLNPAHPLDFADWTWLHIALTLALWGLLAWLSLHLPFGWFSL